MARPLLDVPLIPGGGLSGHAAEFRSGRYTLFARISSSELDLARLRFFRMPVLVADGPDVIHEILVEKWRSFAKTVGIRTALYSLVGNGLFTSDGDLWRRQRKLMAPLFQPSWLETYAAGMLACIDRWTEGFREGDVIDVGHEATRLTMNVVGRALFDVDMDGDAGELGHAIEVIIADLSQQAGTIGLIAKMIAAGALEDLEGRLTGPLERARASILHVLRHPLPLPTAHSRGVREAIRTLDVMVERMIAERRKVGLARPDFLTKLLAARDEDDGATMTDQQVRDEVLTLFFAGHETTAVTVTWSLFALSQHPAVQERARDEVARLDGRAPTVADLPKLPYLLSVIKETLRLYPPAFMFDRIAKEDVEIAGFTVPRGTNIFFFPYALHRRADLYPDPERFDPDRFLPEAEKARPRLAFLPFGAGPRVCIGQQFALMEAQLALAIITQRLVLTPVPGQVVRPGDTATLRPKEPFRMKVEPRRAGVQPAT